MEEIKTPNEIEEAVEQVDMAHMTDDELKANINKTLEKIRNEAIILGYRVACTTIMQMIAPWHNPHASHNDYKRLFKKVEEFCGKALKQAESGAEEPTEASSETAQN